MQQYLSKLLKIRPGEWRVVLLLQLQIFLIIAVLLIAKPAGSALFLARFGSGSLPYMYILTALVAAGVSTAYSQALRYYSILRVNLWSIGICVASLIGFALVIPFPAYKDVVAIGLYLWVALFGVLAASQFWLIANLIFDIRQAKRLFGPIGAGAITGGIVGGYVANIVAGNYGFQPLLLLAGILLLPTLFITVYVWRKYIKGKVPKLARRRKRAEVQENPFRIIQESRHLLLLCGIVALSVITAKLVDYQFSAMALRRFANEDQLTAFFGFWFSTFNVIGLFIQLLITQRVVKFVGISGALSVLPAGLTFGALLMLIMPGLNMAIFSRLIDGSLKQSLHRAGVEMLFLPVSREVKERIKTYIDVFIDSAAGGLGGLLLLLLIDGLGFAPEWISVPVLFLAIAWLVCVIMVREEYLSAFRSQFEHLRPRRQGGLRSKHKEVLEGFLKVLEDRGGEDREQQLLYVLEKTELMEDEEFSRPVSDLLQHASEKVRARALRNLTLRGRTDILEQVIPLINDDAPIVKTAAVEYLISHFPSMARELISEQLKSEDPAIAGNAFMTLIVEAKNQRFIGNNWDLKAYFTNQVERLPTIFPPEDRKAWHLILIQAAGRATNEVAKNFLEAELENPEAAFRHPAILAAGESLDERWLLRLIDFLSETPDRPHASAALVQYGLGLVDLLPQYFRHEEIDLDDVRRLPAVLKQIPRQQTVELLFAMIEKHFPDDLEVRMEVLRALNVIQRNHPAIHILTAPVFRQLMKETKTYRLTLDNRGCQQKLFETEETSDELKESRRQLLQLLEQRQRSSMDRLFRLLGMRYPANDIVPIFRALLSEDSDQQIAALEFLENLLDNSLKKVIIPLVEQEIRPDTSPRSLVELNRSQYTHFRRVLRGRDQRLKLAVLNLIGYLPEERYEKLLTVYMTSGSKRLSAQAARSLQRMQQQPIKR
jgi:AAA family ATP:ADP antiporter